MLLTWPGLEHHRRRRVSSQEPGTVVLDKSLSYSQPQNTCCDIVFSNAACMAKVCLYVYFLIATCSRPISIHIWSNVARLVHSLLPPTHVKQSVGMSVIIVVVVYDTPDLKDQVHVPNCVFRINTVKLSLKHSKNDFLPFKTFWCRRLYGYCYTLL